MLRALSSFLSAIMVVGIVSIVDKGETTTIIVALLCSISLVFHAFDTINYWFQSQYLSKITSIATLIAYIIVSVYKIVLLIFNKNIYWFAFASSVDYIAVAIVLLIAYRKYNGPKFSFSIEKGKCLLSKSYNYILSGMMIAIYGQTDKLMLKQMLDETAVGYYSIAVSICSAWTFVLAAIIDSMYPTIISLHKDNKVLYEKKTSNYMLLFFTLRYLFH